MAVPVMVQAAHVRAHEIGFEISCDDGTGRLLAVLAAAVPSGGRILEIGTGVGAGTSWITYGLGTRADVEVVSIELDEKAASAAAQAPWPSYVRLLRGDALELLGDLGTFDLIFPDAPAGKWTGLRRTIEALRPGGILMVDDMIPKDDMPEEWMGYLRRTRERLLSDDQLVSVEIDDLTGVIVCAKRIT